MFDLHYTTASSNSYKQTFESKDDIFREIAILSTSKQILNWEAFDEQGKCIGHLDKEPKEVAHWDFDESGDYNF
jgi:hypothetical protein